MRRNLGVFAALAVVTALAVSGTEAARQQASHQATECYGLAKAGQSASCTSSFQLNDARFVSDVDTHANYHDYGARGAMTLTWLDARGRTIATYNCAGMGLPGDGAADLTSLNCTRNGEKAAEYVIGTQKLVVTTTNVECGGTATECVFHGRLRLSRAGDIY